MKYIVTRDSDPVGTVCLWLEEANPVFGPEGLWESEMWGTKEFEYDEFNRMYKLTIQPGEKKVMDLVVAWIVEE